MSNHTDILDLSDFELATLNQIVQTESHRRAKMAVMGSNAGTIVWSNELAKRALTVAAAGGHSILFIGPKNSGKTMLRGMGLQLKLKSPVVSYEARTCLCGNRGDPRSNCLCSIEEINGIVSKFPPAEITVEISRLASREIGQTGTSIRYIQEMIDRATKYTDLTLDQFAESIMNAAIRDMGCDLLTIETAKRVARTIANLEGARHVSAGHFAEAINYCRSSWRVS